MSFFEGWLGLYLSGVLTLFAMMNPLAVVPLFLGLTSGMGAAEQGAVAWRAARNAAIILLVCLVAGALVMEFFSISLAALRVAGGLCIAFLGFRLLFAYAEPAEQAHASPHAGRLDPSLVPLALPSLSGAGSMSVVITGSTTIAGSGSWTTRGVGYAVNAAVILTVALSAWLILRVSPRMLRLMGEDGIASLKGIMGFLLVCIGVQYVANGIAEFVSHFAGA